MTPPNHPRPTPRRLSAFVDRVRESLRHDAVPSLEFLDARSRGDLDTEQRFFAGLLLRGGVFKTTHHNRLDDNHNNGRSGPAETDSGHPRISLEH